MSIHRKPGPVATRVLTGAHQTPAQIAAHQAMLADVMPDEQRVTVHGNGADRMTMAEFNARFPMPEPYVPRVYNGPWIVFQWALGVMVAVLIIAGLKWMGVA